MTVVSRSLHLLIFTALWCSGRYVNLSDNDPVVVSKVNHQVRLSGKASYAQLYDTCSLD
ncbi:hypothetical protein PF003_g22494 [Phytophthora fragariae]|nr:hypothetical protein PF003_g22494 [Phytophthora fragariae]